MSAARYVYAYETRRRRIAENIGGPADTPEKVAELLEPMFEGAENERLIVVALDRKQQPIGLEELYRGHAFGTSVRLAELFRFAIRQNAAGVVIAHNHPSGHLAPSSDDLQTTRDAVAAGALLGVTLVDHLIVDDAGRFYSIRQHDAGGAIFRTFA